MLNEIIMRIISKVGVLQMNEVSNEFSSILTFNSNLYTQMTQLEKQCFSNSKTTLSPCKEELHHLLNEE